ncbi:MAG TPA: hypothetical protein VK176_06195, partial [Phycisphaerales bacterium]|nr:hypothetical protein [Phycisphaerales bacterium]
LGADLVVLSQPETLQEPGPRVSGRTDAIGRMIELHTALLPGHDTSLIGALMVQMQAAASEYRGPEREGAATRAADLLAKKFGEHDLSVLACLQEASTVAFYGGRVETAMRLQERACAVWDSLPEGVRDPCLAANAHRLLALAMVQRSASDEALSAAERAVGECERAFGARHHVTGLAIAARAYAKAERGDLAGADADSAFAARIGEELGKTLSVDQLCHIRFIRGWVLCKLGEEKRGREMVEWAWTTLYQHAEPAFVWRQKAEEVLGGVKSAGG